MKLDQVPIPASMVWRVSIALTEHRVSTWLYQWSCDCGQGGVTQHHGEAETKSREHLATSFLAAALHDCTLRDTYGFRTSMGGGVDGLSTPPPRSPGQTLTLQHHITTAAEEVT